MLHFCVEFPFWYYFGLKPWKSPHCSVTYTIFNTCNMDVCVYIYIWIFPMPYLLPEVATTCLTAALFLIFAHNQRCLVVLASSKTQSSALKIQLRLWWVSDNSSCWSFAETWLRSVALLADIKLCSHIILNADFSNQHKTCTTKCQGGKMLYLQLSTALVYWLCLIKALKFSLLVLFFFNILRASCRGAKVLSQLKNNWNKDYSNC